MFLFIFESIGTQELLLIGIVSLIFLGPRRMPQIARTIGKTLKDFRSATNDFKETWEREVNFEEEMKAFKIDDIEPAPIARVDELPDSPGIAAAPEIKEIDKESFDKLRAGSVEPASETKTEILPVVPPENPELSKQNWL